MREVETPLGTVRVADDQPTFWDRVAAGEWEPGTLATLRRLLGPGTLFLDLGAWVGPLTLLAARARARVLAVEADPAAFGQLVRNLVVNPDLAAAVTPLLRAVAPGPGLVRLGARRKPGDSMSSVLLAGSAESWDAVAITPDELATHLRPGERLVAKLDIEGGEYDVLPTVARLIDRPGASLLVSLHPAFLAEAGELNPAARALAALAPFAAWDSYAVGRSGPKRAKIGPKALARHETWLLRRPEADPA